MADHREAARRALDAFNTGDLDAYDEIMAPGWHSHDPQNPFGADRGPVAMKSLATLYRAAFPDLSVTVEEQYEDGDVVVTRWAATGTQNGDLPSLAATGRNVTVQGIVIDRFEGDRVAESWQHWDTLGMLQQLGSVPVAEAAPAA
jgi:predicted ester cyclase